MRFRKSINICKGLRLNLSKSGVSATVGGKGLSLNLGANGVFLNTGIPGTGLYDRKRIAGGTTSGRKAPKRGGVSVSRAEPAPVPDFMLSLDADGRVDVTDGSGRPFHDETLLRRIRATEEYTREYRALMEQYRAALEAQSDAFVNISRQAETVRPASADYAAPDPGDPGFEAFVEGSVDGWLGALELPVEFDVQYDHRASEGVLLLDIDLPEIEDLPDQKAVELASGAVRARDKSQKELRSDYLRCVFGLALFFSSHIFNISPGIAEIWASGYTQRRDRRTGDLQDEYVYSVRFDRARFEGVDFADIDPHGFCMQFANRLNLLANGEMKPVQPYEFD